MTTILRRPGPYSPLYGGAERGHEGGLPDREAAARGVARVIVDAIEADAPADRATAVTSMAKLLIPLPRDPPRPPLRRRVPKVAEAARPACLNSEAGGPAVAYHRGRSRATDCRRNDALSSSNERTLAARLSRLLAEGARPGHRDPFEYLGDFDELSADDQRAILDAIEADDRSRMRSLSLGAWHVGLVRLLRNRKLRWHKNLKARTVFRAAEVLARRGPDRAMGWLRQKRLAAQARFAPTAAAAFAALDVDPRDLAVCYARGISQLPPYRGFWHDEERNITTGSLLGLDLLPSARGQWFIESNLNPGMEPDRAAMYEDDPLATGLLDFAKKGGYRHLVVVLSAPPFDPRTDARLVEGARRRGIALTLLAEAFERRTQWERRHGAPETLERDTLVVRIRHYRTTLDYLLQDKRGSARALSEYARTQGDPGALLPESSAAPPPVAYGGDEPFPNLVYKLPELDAGFGVYFLKAESPEHAVALTETIPHQARRQGLQGLFAALQAGGLFQPYVRGLILDGGVLYKIRSHVLMTPRSSGFLSAHRVVSGVRLPEKVEPGLIKDRNPFLVNHYLGGHYEIPPEEETEGIRRASLGIARALSWAVERGFQTGPEPEGHNSKLKDGLVGPGGLEPPT